MAEYSEADVEAAAEAMSVAEYAVGYSSVYYRPLARAALTTYTGRLTEERRVLREALAEARQFIVDWADYASPYFQEKHDLAGDLAKIDAVLGDGGAG